MTLTPKHLTTAERWLKKEIGIFEVARVYKMKSPSAAYITLSRALRKSYLQGRIEIK